MQRSSKKKRAVVALSLLLALAAVTVAVAYFTGASNSATGAGTVGSSTQWGISMGSVSWSGSLSALYPGAGAINDTEYLPFTVTNNGKGYQSIQSVTVSLPTESAAGEVGDAETAAGADIPGCKSSWFTAALDSGNPTVPADLAAGGTYTGKVDLTMQDSGTNQNACQGVSPAVTVTVS